MAPAHAPGSIGSVAADRGVLRSPLADSPVPQRPSHPGILPRCGARLRPAMSGVLALVLAGGRGTRLGALTERRAKPGVIMGGRHRIIDFTLSNCINSGIPQIGVLTQHLAHTLVPHLSAWNAISHGHRVHTLAASAPDSYLGTADAVYQNRDLIRSRMPSQVLVLAADHVYRMDYAAMLDEHWRRGADVTIGSVEVPLSSASAFGLIEADDSGRVTSFVEKPPNPRPLPGRDDAALASMGIYLFDTGYLLELLAADATDAASSHDFGRDLLPAAIRVAQVQAHGLRDLRDPSLPGYWRDVGTVDAFWRTNLELVAKVPALDTDDAAWPIRGAADAAEIDFPAGVEVRDSVISAGVRVGAGSRIERSVILPGACLGVGCVLHNAVVGEGCRLSDGTVIGVDAEQDRQRYPVTDGGVVLVSADVQSANTSASTSMPPRPAANRA